MRTRPSRTSATFWALRRIELPVPWPFAVGILTYIGIMAFILIKG